jgi:hypothetical protein
MPRYSNASHRGFAPCCGDQPGNIAEPFGVGNTITFAGSGPYSLQTVDLFGYAGGGRQALTVTLPGFAAFQAPDR